MLFDVYFRFLVRYKAFVVIAWGVILAGSIYVGPKFLGATAASFDAPPGTMGAIAQSVYLEKYPRQNESALVFVQDNKGRSLFNTTQLKAITLLLNSTLPSYSEPGVYLDLASWYTFNTTEVGRLLQGSFMNPTNTASIISIDYDKSAFKTTNEREFFGFIRDQLDTLPNPSFTVGLTGINVLFQDVVTGAQKDLLTQDVVVIPTAFFVLALVVRSCQLLIIPIFSVAISILFSYTILYPLAKYAMNVASFTPNIMMSLSIAMSIDYSLFLLTRYREEIIAGRTPLNAVRLMTFHSGKIVLASGSTLAITFLGLVFFPTDFLRTIGIGAAISLLCTMAVNLSLTPCMLLLFPKFFGEFGCGFCKRKNYHHSEREVNFLTDTLAVQEKRILAQQRSMWYRSAVCSTWRPCSFIIIAIILALSIPIGLQVLHMSTTIDADLAFPSNADSLRIFERMKYEFNPGNLCPYYVLMTSSTNNSLLTEPYFHVLEQLLEAVNATDPAANLLSINYVGSSRGFVTFKQAEQMFNKSNPFYDNPYAQAYRLDFKSLVSPDLSTSKVLVHTSFDPLGDASTSWIRRLRGALGDLAADTAEYQASNNVSFNFYLVGGQAQSVDGVDEIYALFPWEIAATGAIVFLIVGVLFRSVFVPIRLVLTIALPILIVYGLGHLVFEEGVLWGWKQTTGIYWLTPVMSFSILVGLGLDYDIFLYSRIHEYRMQDYDDRAAITKGVYRTAGIITAAGIIMAIAFGGLLFSKLMVLDQFGFFLCVAVLVDTFIVRTLLVPALLHLAGPLNWWPGKVPYGTKDALVPEADDF